MKKSTKKKLLKIILDSFYLDNKKNKTKIIFYVTEKDKADFFLNLDSFLTL